MSISISHIKEDKKEKRRPERVSLGKSILFSNFAKKRFKDKQKARLYADLHLLLSSGLDINTTFDILINQTSSQWERKKYQDVQKQIVAGVSLADSMRDLKLAGSYEYYSLKIGEESGKVEDVLSEIKRYYDRRIKQRRQLSGALTYPIMILLTAVIAVGFMINVIVPMFEEVFMRFDGELPGLTQGIIEISDWMKEYAWLLLLLLLGLGLAMAQLWRVEKFKRLCHSLLLRLPLIGKLTRQIQSARFCHIMALLTAAKSPLVQSLQMVSDMLVFFPIKNSVCKAAEDISAGSPLHKAVNRAGFFDNKFTSMIKAGEEVNKLDYSFNQLNDQYNQEIDHKLTILSSLMEPMLIVVVGGIVAVILIAMYLPLFQIGSSIY